MRNSHQMLFIAVLLLATAALAGCFNRPTMSREEARSEIRSAVSLTAESELFVEFVRGGHATRHYAEGHAAYLKDSVTRSVEELEQTTPEASIQNVTAECIQLLKQLSGELSRMRTALDNDTALANASNRIRDIRQALERAQSGL
jgi:hypothetical protein